MNQRRGSTRTSDRKNQNSAMDSGLHELFLNELADVYNAEQQLTKALPKMVKTAETDELRWAFESHLEETRQHVSRLEKIAGELNESLRPQSCAAMRGLIEEADDLIEQQKESSALDAALIAAAQKVEHYEIASYGTLIAWAEQMGHSGAVELLKETLDEEKAADDNLTSVAESVVNRKAQAS